jgi:serine phosphatase RsbU (regulator of sigma subunit)
VTEAPLPDVSDERLRRILSVTDTALSKLAPEALFDELLERIRGLVKADTAAIMLLDQDNQQLVTVAGVGLEDEVHQGFRLNVGDGFAGRVAASRAPVIIDHVDDTTVASPILRATGVITLVGVPMLSHGQLVGVLHLGTFARREFSEHDIALLQLVADRAASASQANHIQADRRATLALQRSLLPTKLPEVDGIDLAARYVPGHQLGVGGDWYDVFSLPSGRLGVVVGDVSGHGLRAAVVMGRLRSALRAYTLIEDDPGVVLTHLDRKIHHFEAGNLATVLYSTVSPDRCELTVSSAGHLPPILARPDEAVDLLPVPPDLPVGVGDATPRRSTTFTLDTGATVAFYTDGLVERRNEHIDQGLRRLTALLRPDPAETVCAAIMAGMDVGRADDDVALLALHTHR